MEKEINNTEDVKIGISNVITLPINTDKDTKDYYTNEGKEWCLSCIRITISKDPNPEIWDIDNTEFTIKEGKNRLVITAMTPKKKI